jgi:galactonate dehydratase
VCGVGKLKITDVKIFVVGNPWKNWVLVKVITDEGLTGIGEATGGLQAMPNAAAVQEMRPLYIGRDPRNVVEIWDRMHKGLYLGRTPAMAGIEIACWDILGKSLGVPVWQLLGGRLRARVRAYANGWYRGPRDPEAFAERARRVVEIGYTALKFDPFGSNFRFLNREEERLSLAIVEAVRVTVGDDVDLLIEAHDRFAPATAVRLAHALADFRPMWIETPVASNDIEATLEVARQVPVPVASGERLATLEEFARLAAGKVVSILQPEVLKIGGIGQMMAVAAIADAHQAFLAPHCAQSPLTTVVNAHIDAAIPNFLIQETFDDFLEPWAREILTGTVEIREGYITVPEAPGLGVDLLEEEAARHPYKDTNFLRLFEPGWERRGEERG